MGESVLLDVSGHPKEISLRKLIDEKKDWLVLFPYGLLVARLDRDSRDSPL